MKIRLRTCVQPDIKSFLSVDQALELDSRTSNKLFSTHVNPGQLKIQNKLGFADFQVESASGLDLITKDGRVIKDFFCGFGTVALGHNHPSITEIQHVALSNDICNLCLAFPSRFVAALSHNLAVLAPADLNKVFLSTSGSEAIEYALKIAEKSRPQSQKTILYASSSFHGKSRGALSVTDSPLYQSDFERLPNCKKFEFGSISSLKSVLDATPSAGVLIIETIQGGAGIRKASPDFWKFLRDETKRRNIVWIADEVQCGLGRTGRLFAFQNYDVSPDIVVLAKALGAGSEAIGACISSDFIYRRSYFSDSASFVHSPATFSGLSRSCLVAISFLNILFDEKLMENSLLVGEYLLDRLVGLCTKYPRFLKEVRGQGLLIGLEFNSLLASMPGLDLTMFPIPDIQEGYIAALVGSLLLSKHSILVGFTQYNKNVIRIAPPLNLTFSQADLFVEALADILDGGLRSMVFSYLQDKKNGWS